MGSTPVAPDLGAEGAAKQADAPAADVAAAATAATSSAPSLFDRVGGMKTLVNAVDVFYPAILADESLAPFFEGIDMARLRLKQVQFLCYAFGGPDEYLGKSVAEAHSRIILHSGANRDHFWAVAGHLKAALARLQVPEVGRGPGVGGGGLGGGRWRCAGAGAPPRARAHAAPPAPPPPPPPPPGPPPTGGLGQHRARRVRLPRAGSAARGRPRPRAPRGHARGRRAAARVRRPRPRPRPRPRRGALRSLAP